MQYTGSNQVSNQNEEEPDTVQYDPWSSRLYKHNLLYHNQVSRRRRWSGVYDTQMRTTAAKHIRVKSQKLALYACELIDWCLRSRSESVKGVQKLLYQGR